MNRRMCVREWVSMCLCLRNVLDKNTEKIYMRTTIRMQIHMWVVTGERIHDQNEWEKKERPNRTNNRMERMATNKRKTELKKHSLRKYKKICNDSQSQVIYQPLNVSCLVASYIYKYTWLRCVFSQGFAITATFIYWALLLCCNNCSPKIHTFRDSATKNTFGIDQKNAQSTIDTILLAKSGKTMQITSTFLT